MPRFYLPSGQIIPRILVPILGSLLALALLHGPSQAGAKTTSLVPTMARTMRPRTASEGHFLSQSAHRGGAAVEPQG